MSSCLFFRHIFFVPLENELRLVFFFYLFFFSFFYFVFFLAESFCPRHRDSSLSLLSKIHVFTAILLLSFRNKKIGKKNEKAGKMKRKYEEKAKKL